MSSTAGMQDAFNKDLNGLEGAAKAYEAAMKEQEAAEQRYKDVILKKLDSLKSADAIMVYLQMYVFQSSLPPSDPNSDASIFGIFGNKVGIEGKELNVNSYLTAVHNDLQKMVDSDSTDPEVVKNVAEDLNKILDDLSGKGSIGNALKDALGSSAGQIFDTDKALRDQFYIVGDTSGYNPNPIPNQPGPDGKYTYHFEYGGASNGGCLTTFAEMQEYMKKTGNQFDAAGAYKALTDNFNSMGSMLQSINSAVNEQINQLTKFIQTLLGFYQNGLLQPGMKLSNVAINNQRTN
ncbi:MAG: hypothetical protein COT85_08040 [Chlamydiae bacterium CG10_big_fil_rev_8_21_14_0_10_42_34]|nr:MAG: hypothetical protein COT85_08040 [Chlamydiae bacterium CG10_big_fil_rev_8_21_14_0_10_42_34]